MKKKESECELCKTWERGFCDAHWPEVKDYIFSPYLKIDQFPKWFTIISRPE